MAETAPKKRTTNKTSRVGSGTKKPITPEVTEVYLEQHEMDRMDILMLEKNNLVLQAKLEQAAVEKQIVEVQKMQVEIELKNLKLSESQNQLAQHDAKRAQYVEKLKAKYQINAPKWSYIPDTGKVILEDPDNGSS